MGEGWPNLCRRAKQSHAGERFGSSLAIAGTTMNDSTRGAVRPYPPANNQPIGGFHAKPTSLEFEFFFSLGKKWRDEKE